MKATIIFIYALKWTLALRSKIKYHMWQNISDINTLTDLKLSDIFLSATIFSLIGLKKVLK